MNSEKEKILSQIRDLKKSTISFRVLILVGVFHCLSMSYIIMNGIKEPFTLAILNSFLIIILAWVSGHVKLINNTVRVAEKITEKIDN